MIKKKSLAVIVSLALCIVAQAQDLVPMHNDKGKFGYGVKGEKKMTIKPQWDEARPFNEQGIAIVREGQMFGLINKQGKPVGEKMGYSVIAPYDGTNYWIVALGGKRVEDANKIKNRLGITPIGFKGSTSYPVSDAKWGLMRKDGTYQITPQYQELSNMMKGNIIVYQKKDLFGCVTIEGQEATKSLFDIITPFNQQAIAAARVKKSGLWVLLNSNGDRLVDEAQKVEDFRQFVNEGIKRQNVIKADSLLKNPKLLGGGLYIPPLMSTGLTWINSESPYVIGVKVIKKKKKKDKTTYEYALYDLKGKTVFSYNEGYSNLYGPMDGVMYCDKKDEFGILDLSTMSFTPFNSPGRVYEPMHNGHAISYLERNGVKSQFYLIDKKGVKKSDTFDDMQEVNGCYIVKSGDSYGVISSSGDEIAPLNYRLIESAGDNLFLAKDNDNKFGFFDIEGNELIPYEYDDAEPFANGYAIVGKKKEKSTQRNHGVINKDNQVVVPIQFSKVIYNVDDNGGLNVWVADKGNYSRYDLKKKKTIATDYKEMVHIPAGIRVTNTDGRYGLLISDTEVIPCVVYNPETIDTLYAYMLDNSLDKLSRMETHLISSRLNADRNSFKLSDEIRENIWDF